MPLYLSRFSYTPETWARLVSNPEDRREAARSYIESVGGKLHGFWYAFGTHDGYNLWEAPDNVSMAAVALAISGGGALSAFESRPGSAKFSEKSARSCYELSRRDHERTTQRPGGGAAARAARHPPNGSGSGRGKLRPYEKNRPGARLTPGKVHNKL